VSDEEDDWFERALREEEAADERDDSASGAETDESAAETDESDAADDADVAPEHEGEDDPFGGMSDAEEADDPFGGVSESGGDDPFGGVSGDSEGGDPFGGDFASAFENAPTPGGDGGDEFGFGDFEPPQFDDEEFDSDIDRIDVGIDGLDEMVLGGVPRRSLMVAIGSAGTGKTTFGLQFLHEALSNDGKVAFISLEESRERVLNSADEKGWEFRRHEEAGRLALLDLDPIEMSNSLSSIQNDLPRLVSEFGADRLVLDSVSLLEMMYDSDSERRSEVFDFARSLKAAGVTTFLTSEADADTAYASRYGLIEYLADAVFVLQYVRPSDFRETRLAVEIQKIRDANHSRETKPYEITDEGISVYRQANIF
jgi:KaiC domain protein